jgi:hypothetical protein
MKIKDILKGAAGVVAYANPALGAAVAAINTFLPDSDQIPTNANGKQVEAALGNLPSNQQLQLLEKEIDLEIRKAETWADIQKAHSETDAKGASTRPTIAMCMAFTVCASVLPISFALAWAIFTNDSETIKIIDAAVWPLLALIGTPTVLLRSYFGMRTNEKKARYAASVGSPVNTGILDTISRHLKR